MSHDGKPREVQAMMIAADTIAAGGNPGCRYGPDAKAPNKMALIAGILGNQPETRKDGLARIRAYYAAGGAMWCHGAAVEVLSTSHEHNHLGGMALHLRAAVLPTVDEALYQIAADAWRLWTAAVRHCSYYRTTEKAHGRQVREYALQHPGARGKDMDHGELAIEATNSCADKVADGLLNDHWRNASSQWDVALPLLQQAMAAMVKAGLAKSWDAACWALVGDDHGPLTDRFGYRVVTGPWGHYASFARLDGAFDPLYGAGRIDGQIVLEWEAEAAVERGRLLADRAA